MDVRRLVKWILFFTGNGEYKSVILVYFPVIVDGDIVFALREDCCALVSSRD